MIIQQAQPYLRHSQESLHFTSAIVYILEAATTAESAPTSDLGKLHVEFTAQFPNTYGKPRDYFLAQLFVARVASFEVFLQETVSLVIQKNPKKVGSTEFRLAEILDSPDVSILVQRAAEEFLNKLMYKKPSEYLVSLCELLSVERASLQDDWSHFVEAKARRDLGMHNAWKCNQTYIRKLTEAGLSTELKIGESALPRQDDYVLDVDHALDRLAKSMTNSMLEKHWPELTIRF